MTKFLITGDRDWEGPKLHFHVRDALREQLRLLDWPPAEQVIVVHGNAKGVDLTAEAVCKELSIPTDPMPAQWDLYHRAAGPIRNREMLKKHPDIFKVLAFHRNIGKSKGTKDMVIAALKAGLDVKIYDGTQTWKG